MESTTNEAAAICTVCQSRFNASEVVKYENDTVCFNCKNEYFQKVREGVSTTGVQELSYASIGKRFLAQVIDGLIMMAAGFIINLILLGSLLNQNAYTSAIGLLATFAGFIGGIIYHVAFVGSRGATPGKIAMSIKIVNPDGRPITYAHAAGRYFATYISSITLMIGYLIAFFDDEKRALHDRIASTRVIDL